MLDGRDGHVHWPVSVQGDGQLPPEVMDLMRGNPYGLMPFGI